MILAAVLLAQVAWAKDLPTALNEAGPGRMVIAHFWRPDCPWCEKLEFETYKEAGFGEVVQLAVPVKIAGEADGAPLAAKFGVRGYPTILFLDARGETLGRIQGFVSIDALQFEGLASAKRRGALRGTDESGAVARVEVFAARRDEPMMVAALEDARR